MRDLLLLVPVAAFLACEQPVQLSGLDPLVTRVVVSPAQLALKTNQTSALMAVGLTATGDTGNLAVKWSTTGGSIADTFSNGRYHVATYQPSAAPGDYLVIAASTAGGMADTSTVTVTPVSVASVALSPTVASLLVGATLQLTATPQDSSGTPLTERIVTWLSSAPAVASVNGSGLVTAAAAGSATVSATSEGKSASAIITVTTVPVDSVTVSPASATISVGATRQLAAVTRDSAGNNLTGRPVTWTSGNTSVATVSSAGLVTGQAAGSATITATSEGKTGTAAITIQAPAPPGPRAGYYVAPNGSASGDGSAARPWNLATGLGSPAAVGPGDTIWLRGGTYAGSFTSSLSGTLANPIVVRQYPGERATIDGTLTVSNGSHVWFWGFEVMRSVRGSSNLGINVQTPGIRLINLVVHDATMSGIYLQASGSLNSEIYGCICYNNGDNTNLDHGIYAHTMGASTGALLIEDNITFNNLAFGLHQYATGGAGQTLRNITQRGNVSFNNNTIWTVTWGTDLLHGGSGTPVVNGVVRDNFVFRNLTEPIDYAMWIGYSGVTGTSVSVIDNYGASTSPVQIHPFTTLVNTGNAIYRWGVGPAPTTNRVVVRPNKYEAGRAHIIVYNWALQSSVSVDVSGILNVGDGYVVKNAQNFYGGPVLTGTYGGGVLQLPMAGIPAPVPIGRGTPGPVTGPTFNVFVLMKTP